MNISKTKALEDAQSKAEEKAKELSIKYQTKVNPIVFKVDAESDDIVIGYLKEPQRFVKLRMMDKGMTSPITAASEVMETCLIKEESDPRIMSEAQENDVFYIGATKVVYDLVQVAINLVKKN